MQYSHPAGAPPALLKAGLVATLALLGAALAEPAAGKLAVLLHLLLRIYDGRVTGWRRISWLALVLGVFLSVAAGFLGHVLPWGQLSFSLATHFGTVGWWLAGAFSGAAAPYPRLLIGALLWLALAADMVALHAAGFRGRSVWRSIGVLALAFLTPPIISDIWHLTRPVEQLGGLPTPAKILPDLDELPLFAILRSTPSKGLGVGLVALALLLPVAAAWTRAWRSHAPPTRLAWTMATAALAVSWMILGVLGALPPPEGLQWTVLALVAWQVAFFVAVPVILGRYAQPADRRASVFD